LCVVRIGAADPNLIKAIIAHFDTLDASGDGALSMDEICELAVAEKQAVRRASMNPDALSLAQIQMSVMRQAPEEESKERGGGRERERDIAVPETQPSTDDSYAAFLAWRAGANAAAEHKSLSPSPSGARLTSIGMLFAASADAAPTPPPTPPPLAFVPLAVSQLLRPRLISPTRVPMRFDLENSESESEDGDASEEVVYKPRGSAEAETGAEADALGVKPPAASASAPTAVAGILNDETASADADAGADADTAIAQLEEAWELLNDERYIVKGEFASSRELLGELGVYCADDLADAGVHILAESILPLLKPVPRNKVLRLLRLDPAQAALPLPRSQPRSQRDY
jgi:hypothetical protein